MNGGTVDADAINQWRSQFIPLAVEKTILLWESAGIPEVIAFRPTDLVRIARDFLARTEAPTGSGNQFRSRLIEELQRAFEEIDSTYGHSLGTSLYEWMKGCVERHGQVDVDDWEAHFRRLVRSFNERKLDLPRMDTTTLHTLVARVREGLRLMDNARVTLYELAEQAKARPLLPEEVRFVRLESGEGEPGPVLMDPVQQLMLTAWDRDQKDFTASVFADLNEDDRTALIQWAREEVNRTDIVRGGGW